LDRRARAAAFAAALIPLCAAAQQPPERVTFSGFGTLGAVRTDTDAGRYVTSLLQPGGARRDWDLRPDSLLAAQVNARLTRDIAGVVQAVMNRRAQDDFIPHIEWAFLHDSLTPDLDVRAGIMAVPIFMLSDSRLVGISFPWVRPPTALYSQAPITNFRGAELLYRKVVGDVAMTLQPYVGKAPTDVPVTAGTVRSHLDHMVGGAVSAEWGHWTLRTSYLQCDVTYPSANVMRYVSELRDAAGTLAGAAELADQIDANGKRLSFTSAGASYDAGAWFFQAEYGRRRSDTLVLARSHSWYGTLGYRFGNFITHATVSRTRVDSATSQDVVPSAGSFAALATGLNSMLGSQDVAQRTFALGLRWQFQPNADFKVQFDRVNLPGGAIGNFNAPRGFADSVNVYSAAVDVVF
jgi:hypothetical protein